VQFVPEVDSQTVRLVTEPVLPTLQIVNAVTLSEGACGDWVSKLKFEAQGSGETARFTVSGPYARECGERTRSFSVLDHRSYVGALFAQLWKELGGTFTGKVRDGSVPSGARLIATATSPQLSEIVRDVNKFSNNVMARQLFLTLATVFEEPPGTTDKARNVIRRWLEQKKLPIPELAMENGSGLSRIERISARSMGELLLAAFRSAVMPELMASLPVFAVDGTMRKRLGQPQVAGQAHIKGGTLSGVRAIAGYVLDAQGRRVVMVFIVNHANAPNAMAAQDALLRWIHQR
jgi:serine-type D-Ala-D-Ala carboxypeptidase/endopeptidase (penicillin-binding protein 4)